jgi:hypothetical protein
VQCKKRKDCSGTVNRQLIEISSWFSRVYSKNTLGLTSLWQNLIETLSSTDEDGLDLGYWETYSVAFPAMLAPDAPLTTLKFSSNSSHTTTRGMVSEASNVLLSTLINLLQCNFATAANSEDIFSAEPASQESSLDKKIIYVFGGSNMKKVIPHLDSQRFEIRDHTIPGWLPNTANIDILAKTLETQRRTPLPYWIYWVMWHTGTLSAMVPLPSRIRQGENTTLKAKYDSLVCIH